MNYLLHLVIYLSIYVIVAHGLNIIVGYCGLLSLGQAVFFAVGGYAYALVSLKFGMGLLPAILVGFGCSIILSFLLSLPSWRLRGDQFVLITLGFQALSYSVIYNWTSTNSAMGTCSNLTNGPFGIANIPRPSLFGFVIDSLGVLAVLSFVLAALCTLISWRLLSSPWGRLLKAIRDDELASRGLGKNVRVAKVQAFAIASGIASVGGSLYASYVGYIDPGLASLDESILILCMVVIGGLGNIRGPLIGALILTAAPEILRLAHVPNGIAANIRLMCFGLLLTLLMHFRPHGVAGEYRFD